MLKEEIKRRDLKMMECLGDVETGVTVSNCQYLSVTYSNANKSNK